MNELNKEIHKKNVIQSKINNLALCGGGIYGYAEIGAMSELEKYSEYIDINTISGTSVGSIVAALYAVGYDIDSLIKIIFEMDFNKLICDTWIPYINVFFKYGMYNADGLEAEIERLITKKTHIKNCTFSQIKINLKIVTTNLNYQRAEIFDKISTPMMIISKAVRMSISFPFTITPSLWNGDLYGDGGEFVNYPIILFENLEQTIGIAFASYNENKDGTLRNRIPINSIFDLIKSTGTTMTRATYVSQITQKYLDRSIIIHISKDINSMQFNLTKEQKQFILECGIEAVKKQINYIVNIDDNS
uniref:PNPLA domain-containing protein n=1 Tax=viral metagenome TaxID=1070528 RepID=A0A6C0LTC4_9ZZZZ